MIYKNMNPSNLLQRNIETPKRENKERVDFVRKKGMKCYETSILLYPAGIPGVSGGGGCCFTHLKPTHPRGGAPCMLEKRWVVKGMWQKDYEKQANQCESNRNETYVFLLTSFCVSITLSMVHIGCSGNGWSHHILVLFSFVHGKSVWLLGQGSILSKVTGDMLSIWSPMFNVLMLMNSWGCTGFCAIASFASHSSSQWIHIWKMYDNAPVYINLWILNSLSIVRSRCSLVACADILNWLFWCSLCVEWSRQFVQLRSGTPWTTIIIWTACNTPLLYRLQLFCMFCMFPTQSCICIHWLSYIVPRNLTCCFAVLMNFSILSLVSLHVAFLGGVYGSICLYVFVILCVIDPGLPCCGWASWAGRDAVQDPGTGCSGQRDLVKDDGVFTVFWVQYGCFPCFHPLFWYATTLGGDRWLFRGILQLESLEMLHMHLEDHLIIRMQLQDSSPFATVFVFTDALARHLRPDLLWPCYVTLPK